MMLKKNEQFTGNIKFKQQLTMQQKKGLDLKTYLKSSFMVIVNVTLSNPLELVRFRLQTERELLDKGELKIRYLGIIDCFRRIAKEEGFKAFLKGNLSNICRVIPSQMLIFEIKEILHHQFEHYFQNQFNRNQLKVVNSVIGIMASFTTLFALYPFDYLRVILSNDVQNKGYTLFQSLVYTVKNYGITRLYKGFSILLVGAIIFRGTYFGIFDSFKHDTGGYYERWLLSYVAMCSAVYLPFPIDTVRRRMITAPKKYKGAFDCAKSIIQGQGLRALMRGSSIIPIQSLNYATFYFIYDLIFTEWNTQKI